MNKYFGLAAEHETAEKIKAFAKASLGDEVHLLWQDTGYLIFEISEKSDKEVLFRQFLSSCSLNSPCLVMEQGEFKNSPAELLEYLDAVKWMKAGCRSEKKSRASEQENQQNTYQALLLGQVCGVRDYLLKGNKGMEASICAMKSLAEKFSVISDEIIKKVQTVGGNAAFAGGSAEIMLPVSGRNHCLFQVMEFMKRICENERSFAFAEGLPAIHMMAYLFPSEMDVQQAKAEAERLFSSENDQNGDSIYLYIERRLGKGMVICIPDKRLPALDDRISFTCRNIGNGADYMRLLANSIYDEMLLEYCRFLNHECSEHMDSAEESVKKG